MRIVPAWAVDAAIALAVALLGLSSGLGAGRPGHVSPAATAALTAMGVILAARRRFPGAVLVLMAGLVAWLDAVHTSLEGAFVAVLVACYSSAVHGSRLLARLVLVAAVGILLGVGVAEAVGADSQVPGVVKTILAGAGAWLVGLAVRRQLQARQEHIVALAERAELIAAQHEERARRATLAERLRIARELHDIVAHHLSVVVIQAQAAQRVPDPDRARQAMADVEHTGRTALDEMRRLLGLLRTGEADEERVSGGLGGGSSPPEPAANLPMFPPLPRSAWLISHF